MAHDNGTHAPLTLDAEATRERLGCGYARVDGCRGRLQELREVRVTPTTTTVAYTCATCGRDWDVSYRRDLDGARDA